MSDLARRSGAARGFVEIALPVPLRQTFTYFLKSSDVGRTKIGSRVIVPFGKRLLTGYVVDVFDTLPADADIDESKLKDVREVLDEEPILTAEIIELVRWTADYYLSFIGEVLRASLPAGMSRKGQEHFSITAE